MERRAKELPTAVSTGLFASSGVMVACALQPLDVVKIRLQMGMGFYRGVAHCVVSIIANEGLAGLYAGTSAALLRHATHAIAWVSAHSIFIRTVTDERAIEAAQSLLSGRGSLARVMGFHLQVQYPATLVEHGILRGFCYGAIIGASAAIVSNPAEVAMVRMATDGLLPGAKRHRYRHVVDAMWRMRLTEGTRVLWTGTGPTVLRNILSIGFGVPFYAMMYSSLISSGMQSDSASLNFCCGIATGLGSAVVSLPVDHTKTRDQCSAKTRYYTESTLQLLRTMMPRQALRAIYRGFPPYASKILLQSALAAVCYDCLADAYRYLAGTHAPSDDDT